MEADRQYGRKLKEPKLSKPKAPVPPGGLFLVYQTEDGRTRIECRFEEETVWLTQALMAELFQTTPQNITLHLRANSARRQLVRITYKFEWKARGRCSGPCGITIWKRFWPLVSGRGDVAALEALKKSLLQHAFTGQL